jgi:hypothetical protein
MFRSICSAIRWAFFGFRLKLALLPLQPVRFFLGETGCIQ